MCPPDAEKNELKPWRKKPWGIAPEANAEFVCKMADVLDVYPRPYDSQRPLVCLDETSKSRRAGMGETRAAVSAAPGRPARYDYEYVRNGTANVFLFCEPLAGKRQVRITARRTKVDWAQRVRELVDQTYPRAEKVVLVMDNLNTHAPASLYEAFAPAEAKRIARKLELVHTPKHGSWLNMAEIELGLLGRQCLDRRIANATTLEREAAGWEATRNAKKAKIDWRFTTAGARVKLKKLYPSIQE